MIFILLCTSPIYAQSNPDDVLNLSKGLDAIERGNYTETNVHLKELKNPIAKTILKLFAFANVCKFNIGTELRKTFGDSLRFSLKNNPETYDKIQLLDSTANDIKKATKIVIENLSKV